MGSTFFGYRSVSIHGTSMEPALRDGDALWVKYLDPAEVKVEDIVVLQDAVSGPISHRVVNVEEYTGLRHSLRPLSSHWPMMIEISTLPLRQ